MKKIPTLFERAFENHKKVGVLPNVAPGMEWVLFGEGIATEKMDGSCCAIIDGKFYKRYDAKRGKKPPVCAIPCCEPDEITGHWPHWVQVNPEDRGDMWHVTAYQNSNGSNLVDGTYEVVGPHFRNNPYGLEKDILIKHGEHILEDIPRSFESIREYLKNNYIEGIVFWRDQEPKCKIKRSDFGFEWNEKR